MRSEKNYHSLFFIYALQPISFPKIFEPSPPPLILKPRLSCNPYGITHVELIQYANVLELVYYLITAQKGKFSIMNFFSKCDQIRRKLRIWSHLLQKSLMDNFIFCAVNVEQAGWVHADALFFPPAIMKRISTTFNRVLLILVFIKRKEINILKEFSTKYESTLQRWLKIKADSQNSKKRQNA